MLDELSGSESGNAPVLGSLGNAKFEIEGREELKKRFNAGRGMSTFNLRDGGLAQARFVAKLALCQSLFFAGTADDVADLFGITSQLHNAKICAKSNILSIFDLAHKNSVYEFASRADTADGVLSVAVERRD